MLDHQAADDARARPRERRVGHRSFVERERLIDPREAPLRRVEVVGAAVTRLLRRGLRRVGDEEPEPVDDRPRDGADLLEGDLHLVARERPVTHRPERLVVLEPAREVLLRVVKDPVERTTARLVRDADRLLPRAAEDSDRVGAAHSREPTQEPVWSTTRSRLEPVRAEELLGGDAEVAGAEAPLRPPLAPETAERPRPVHLKPSPRASDLSSRASAASVP